MWLLCFCFDAGCIYVGRVVLSPPPPPRLQHTTHVTHTHTHTRTHACTRKHPHPPTHYTRTQTHNTHAHTRTHTLHVYTHTHTHTHIHTHTQHYQKLSFPVFLLCRTQNEKTPTPVHRASPPWPSWLARSHPYLLYPQALNTVRNCVDFKQISAFIACQTHLPRSASCP